MKIASLARLDGVADLGLRSGLDMRPTLLRVLTDLYVQKFTHTADEERHYTELALRLLEVVDVPTRLAVAGRLTRHLAPPLRVLQRLDNDLREVAAAVHTHPLLQQGLQRDEAPPVMSTGPATTAPGEAASVPEFVRAEDPSVADVAPALDSDTADELNELFFAANASERRLILLTLDATAPHAPVRAIIPRDRSVGLRLEAAALAGKREEFAQQLARALRVSLEHARRIARDELGEPLVVFAKALGIERDLFYRMLIFVNPAVGHSVERVHALAVLYDEMTPQAGESMVAIWQALRKSRRPAAVFRPLAREDETRQRARAAAPLERVATTPPAKAGARRNAW